MSPSAKAFLLFLPEVKQKTPLEVMREFNEEARQRKVQKEQEREKEPK